MNMNQNRQQPLTTSTSHTTTPTNEQKLSSEIESTPLQEVYSRVHNLSITDDEQFKNEWRESSHTINDIETLHDNIRVNPKPNDNGSKMLTSKKKHPHIFSYTLNRHNLASSLPIIKCKSAPGKKGFVMAICEMADIDKGSKSYYHDHVRQNLEDEDSKESETDSNEYNFQFLSTQTRPRIRPRIRPRTPPPPNLALPSLDVVPLPPPLPPQNIPLSLPGIQDIFGDTTYTMNDTDGTTESEIEYKQPANLENKILGKPIAVKLCVVYKNVCFCQITHKIYRKSEQDIGVGLQVVIRNSFIIKRDSHNIIWIITMLDYN